MPPTTCLTLKGNGWLVGCFGFNGPLRQYFSLYRAVSQREGEGRERIDESKNVQTTPTRTYCKRNRPLPYCNPNCRTPGTGSLPSTIAPPDHPPKGEWSLKENNSELHYGIPSKVNQFIYTLVCNCMPNIRILSKAVLQIFYSQGCSYTKCLCLKKGSNSTENFLNRCKS